MIFRKYSQTCSFPETCTLRKAIHAFLTWRENVLVVSQQPHGNCDGIFSTSLTFSMVSSPKYKFGENPIFGLSQVDSNKSVRKSKCITRVNTTYIYKWSIQFVYPKSPLRNVRPGSIRLFWGMDGCQKRCSSAWSRKASLLWGHWISQCKTNSASVQKTQNPFAC